MRRGTTAGMMCAVIFGSCTLPAAPRAARPPNILFIVPDQLRAQAIGCAGNPDVRTPNLDRLAAEGLVFNQAFANSPVCCPARAIMLTGKYAHRNGMTANDLRLRESETTLAEVLQADGYRTGFIGKWHLDGGRREPGFVPPGARRQGFDYWAASECSHDHFNNYYFRDGPTPIPLGKYEVEGWTDLAVEFLRRQEERPFFLMLMMGPPHDPYKGPPRYESLYDPARLAMRPNWVEGIPMGSRQDIASYYAQITAIDDQVGRLMSVLEELHLRDETIVVFTSDHGDMLGSQGQRLKRKPWEESIRVPCFVSCSGRVRAGARTDAIITHVDMAPTVLGLCGLRIPAGMQGTDMSGVVRGRSGRGPDSAFFQIFGPYNGDSTPFGWRGVRTGWYMYVRSQQHPWMLFDLERDPYQLRNLAGDPAAASVQADMEKKLRGWMKRTGDSWSYDWTELVEDNGRLYAGDAFYSVADYLKWLSAR